MNEFNKKTGMIPGPAIDLPTKFSEVAFTISISVFKNGQVGDIIGPQNIKSHAVIDVLATAIKMMCLVTEEKKEPSSIIIPKLVGAKPFV